MNTITRLLLATGMIAAFATSCKEDDPEVVPDSPSVGTPYTLQIPGNLPPMSVPANNPMTVEGVALGRFLFYEERLSGDNTMSCGTCHSPSLAFTDGNAVSEGIDGVAGTRSAMALINLGYANSFFWDGRAGTLEEQILMPVRDPIEMHESWMNAMAELQAHPAYPGLFNAAFGTYTIDSTLAAKAIAQFIRTLISGNSKYDRVVRGEDVFTPNESEGLFLFRAEGGAEGMQIQIPGMDSTVTGQGGADCFHCHTDGAGLFTDEQFHNNAVQQVPYTDPGRAAITNDPFDMGRFKTPTLRNIMLTAPYMHDGRFATIDEVLDHYNDGGHPGPTVDPFMKFTDPELSLELTAQKRIQVKAFLNALTDMDFVNNPAFADPGEPQ